MPLKNHGHLAPDGEGERNVAKQREPPYFREILPEPMRADADADAETPRIDRLAAGELIPWLTTDLVNVDGLARLAHFGRKFAEVPPELFI